MFQWSRYIHLAAAVAALSLFGVGKAGAVVLTFEGLKDQEAIQGFYNGMTGGMGSGPGPNFGVTFSNNAIALIDIDAGGTGNFGGEPSPSTTLFLETGMAATMNIPVGFDTSLSFFYSAINLPGSVTLYDDLNATGNVLTTLTLPLTPDTGAPDPTGEFSPLVPVTLPFSGIARSVDFGGTPNQISFDNIDFTPIPEPASMAILGVGVLPLLRRLRRRQG